jgi:hypothetical protein
MLLTTLTLRNGERTVFAGVPRSVHAVIHEKSPSVSESLLHEVPGASTVRVAWTLVQSHVGGAPSLVTFDAGKKLIERRALSLDSVT